MAVDEGAYHCFRTPQATTMLFNSLTLSSSMMGYRGKRWLVGRGEVMRRAVRTAVEEVVKVRGFASFAA